MARPMPRVPPVTMALFPTLPRRPLPEAGARDEPTLEASAARVYAASLEAMGSGIDSAPAFLSP
jgi:hypothetical protein